MAVFFEVWTSGFFACRLHWYWGQARLKVGWARIGRSGRVSEHRFGQVSVAGVPAPPAFFVDLSRLVGMCPGRQPLPMCQGRV